MRVSIKAMRRLGRRGGEYGTSASQRIPGELLLHTASGAQGAYAVATFKGGAAPKDPDLLPPLYEPAIVTIGNTGFMLRGFESVDGASYVQEWHCDVDQGIR